ncbi:MAG: 1-deoxy-D-xylulose-5-phosphate reductoisomerase [Pseudomonadota bacterium]
MALARTQPCAVAAPRRITILGSSGSVGCNTIDLIERDLPAYEIEALTAHTNVEVLADQARRLRPKLAVVADESCYRELKEALAGLDIEVAAGQEALDEAAARPADWVMAAIVGAAGLAPTLTAVRRGAAIALANKETLVCAGQLMVSEIAAHGATLLPVDSEHNAIFQVLEPGRRDSVERIILTASGGPFRDWKIEDMARATPAQAVAHPNWDMGAKISVDSATMMNKGLELIEAVHLFGLPQEQIEILVHPQSVIHSMVAYVDGSVLAQLGQPDMRTPIAYTLAWPDRMHAPVDRLDFATNHTLTFEPPDPARFPALRLAREALSAGGCAPTVLNAANEVAVQAFLDGEIGFCAISEVVERVLNDYQIENLESLEQVHEIDLTARARASGALNGAR